MAATDVPFHLGIDIGTTSVKLSLIGPTNRRVIDEPISTSSNAAMPSLSAPREGSEQSISLIFQAIEKCLEKLGSERLRHVSRVGVTGQMHGCVLWKSKAATLVGGALQVRSGDVSPLFDWQDGRCSSSFLATLPKPNSHLRLATGHGCATLFWWTKNHPRYLEQFSHSGTVMDLFVAALCGRDDPVMSVQNAASWSYFNCQSETWNAEILSAAGFPIHLLPKVQLPGSLAGTMQTSWLGLSPGVQVAVAMGDLPCSVYSILDAPTDAVVNVGTSAQLVRSMPEDFIPAVDSVPSSVEHFAYFDQKYIAVAAALNGGNVLSTFVDTLVRWCASLGSGGPTDRDEAFAKVIDLAAEAETDLVVDPALLGERHRRDDRGAVSNLRPDNVDLGGFFRAVCRGVVTNVESMMPEGELRKAGVERIVGCGSALSQNPILKEELERCFELPVIYRDDSDACLGAAMYVQSADW